MTSYAAAVDTPERERNVTTDYDAARAERDAALQKLRALAPANTSPPPLPQRKPPRTPPRTPRGVRFEPTPLGTIKEGSSERGSEDVKKPEEPKKKKKGLLARIRRGVAKRVGTSSSKPRAWEPTQKRKPAPKKKGRLSEQPFAPTDFERRRVLGRGGFGVVYLVEKKLAPDQGRNYAMKVLDKHKLLKGGQRSQARLERDVLRVVRHPFVARLRVSFQTETRLYLLSDFYCGGCLTEFRKDHDISKEGARFYVVELALALAYLHAQGVVRSGVEIDPSRRWRGSATPSSRIASMAWGACNSSNRARNRKKDHPRPRLMETTRIDAVKAPQHLFSRAGPPRPQARERVSRQAGPRRALRLRHRRGLFRVHQHAAQEARCQNSR